MKTLNIELFEGDKKEATIRIPVAVLNLASKFFPQKYLSSLDKSDVSLPEIIEAASNPKVSGRLIEIEDHKDNERVVISVS